MISKQDAGPLRQLWVNLPDSQLLEVNKDLDQLSAEILDRRILDKVIDYAAYARVMSAGNHLDVTNLLFASY